MARLPRVVIPGISHHVTQRGNRRERTFFEEGDYALYLDLLADAARQARTEVVLLSHAEITVTVYKMHQIPGAQKILSYSR